MPQEKIIIKFSAQGDKALNHAIKQLHASQVLLDKGTKEYRRVLKQLNLEQQKAIANTGALAVSHTRLGAQNKLLARSFATLRSQLLLISFGAMLVERAFVSLVKAYGRQEAANEKLRVGLGNVADTTAGVTQRLVDYSAALQQTTAFGDEMITTGMVQFTTFGLNEKAIKALTPQVLNVARAIQTVSGAMPDLNSLFIAFGKATTTGIGTLTRYGVVLTETERAQLGSMDANESAVKIAEILARQYGGLSEAYAKTTSGMLEAAALARGDAAEAFGKVLAPAVLAASQGLKIMFEAMSPERIKQYGSGMIIAASATTALAVATGKLNVSLAITKTALIRTGIGAMVVVAGLATGKLLDMFGVFEDGDKVLDDAGKKLKKFNDELERDITLAKELQEVQENSVKSLQKQLDLLNAETEAEKMLINLGHDASEQELFLIAQIINKTKAIQAEKDAKKLLAEIDKLKAEQEKEANSDRIKELNELIKFLEKETSARQTLLGVLSEENQKKLEMAQATLAIGGEMLGQFNNMTSTMSAGVNARMKNEMDAIKETTAYKMADSDKRKQMEADVNKKFAEERTRLAKFEKAASLAQASIAIATAIAKAVPNAILMALIAAMGAVQIGAIASTPIPKFAQGGMIGGRRHSQGGTMIEAEQGEFVMSRGAVESVGIENLNQMNQGGGGGSVTVNVSGNVMTEEFTTEQIIPAIREALRRGENLNHSHIANFHGGETKMTNWDV